MTDHPRPWRCVETIADDGGKFWRILDKNEWVVGIIYREPTARLIVDQANAAEIQRKTGIHAVPIGWGDNPRWRAARNFGDMPADFHGNSFPTHHAAILAAHAWLKQKGQGQ